MSNPASTPGDRQEGNGPSQPAQAPAAQPAGQQSPVQPAAAGRKPHVPATGQTARPTEKLQVPPAGKRTGTSSASGGRDAAKSKNKPYKSSDDWGVFRAVVIGVGILVAGVGVYYLVTGTAGVADTGGGEVNASLESQFRFFSAMMVGVGAAFIAIAVKFQWANMLWLVCLMVFLGGIGRVLSWAFSGTPHFTMIILMILELAFPPALLVWHRFIAKTSELKREYSEGGAARGSAASAGGAQS
ncbi:MULTISPECIES: DUF4345 domain-containing protein [Arthrobacter]|uniref:DUF4345 domain-containing protein n=1 Tax=Arthrobacter sunyaminii TaxID=2816859 RepID=A0A975XLV5_9MICC|nr:MULTISPECIES: DUF4345 domain-containing protein [Arthrobacter]MBO0896617.1 DUF4345 domain-containing protein [Arthrobacter sunyaminii]MBO0908328.1 DUF4345 domain-containing protein [Arthrobacter sunyaminii]QWQ37314.1 DUF4345 domain-containing protein [Arthrobacter sunyaminii]